MVQLKLVVDQLLIVTLGLLKGLSCLPECIVGSRTIFLSRVMSSGGILVSLKYLFEGWDHCIGQNFHHFMANRSDKYLASKPIYQPFDLAELTSFDPICVTAWFQTICFSVLL